MYGRTTIFDQLRREINTEKLITRLILANVLIFVALNVLAVVGLIVYGSGGQGRAETLYLINKVLYWVQMPAQPIELLYHPWAIITHMFVHYQFFHLLFNMIALYWFGTILHEYIGAKKLLPLYFYGGIVGGLLFMLSSTFLPIPVPLGSVAIGASASVLAIVVAAATLLPDHIIKLFFFGEVKIKYMALVLVLLANISPLHDQSYGTIIAHLGGALFGFVYIRQMKVGHDWSLPFNNLLLFFRDLPDRFRRKKYPHVAYKRKTPTAGSRPSHLHVASKNKQERVDTILDKINQSGYDSLSKEEKEFLFRSSKED